MGFPTVSVVMPSLNQRGYIATAAHSVLQRAGDDTELVVADGGSTDGTLDVLATLAGQYPGRVRWFSGPDDGPADAVNQAVARARGEYLGWLNADDVYARGAVGRAVQHLQRHPGHVLVYGHGEHIDASGGTIGKYATLPPDVPLSAFADGSFICQPTAFFRREAFLQLGGLDTRLRASFDFDLWLRLFRKFPQGVGFINKVQAYSRLHDQCITRMNRERVALEGLEVVARHFGHAPAHWMLTHIEEVLAEQPFRMEGFSLATELERLVALAEPHLDCGQRDLLRERIANDRRLAIADDAVFVAVYPDGWAGTTLEVRFQQPRNVIGEIVLHGRHAAPQSRLRLEVSSPADGSWPVVRHERGPFEILLPVESAPAGSRMIFRIRSNDCFVPARKDRGSDDERRLAFLVEGCELR